MKYMDLQREVASNVFTLLDVIKLFPDEREQLVKVQLSRFAKKELISQIKRGIYCFDQKKIDEFDLANRLYQPSYISLETALNYYGIIPDISQSVTSVTLTTTKAMMNQFGSFTYTKIAHRLFFGFIKVQSVEGLSHFTIAQKEKALLDYLYIRKIRSFIDLRLNLNTIDSEIYRSYSKSYPSWVRKLQI